MIKRALGLFAGGEGAAEEDDDSDDVTPAQRQKLERTAHMESYSGLFLSSSLT